MSCVVVGHLANFVDIHMLDYSALEWRLTCYYGFSERNKGKDSWNLLRSLSSISSLPWCIIGDFNDLLTTTDKMGKHLHPQELLDGFKEAISDCTLSEIDLVGGSFTWENNRGKPNWIHEKFDRAFGNIEWWTKFPLCKLTLLHTVVSDHNPLLIDFISTSFSKKKFRFRFENT